MHRPLPFTQLVVTWLLIAPQPLDVPRPSNAPSGCCVASCCAALLFAPAGCSITSRCTAAPPPPLNASAPASPPVCLLVPGRLFFSDARCQQMSGRKWDQCLVFGRLVCCELPPRSHQKIVSHELHLCKLAKLFLGSNANKHKHKFTLPCININ
jgi:hypothetical protein